MNVSALDVFQLQSNLRAYRAFASASTAQMLQAFDSEEGGQLTPLAMEALERTREALDSLLLLPELDEDELLSEQAITRLSRMIAVAVNGHVATRYQKARTQASVSPLPRIVRALSAAEKTYASALLDTRAGAKSGRMGRLAGALSSCLGLGQRALPYLAAELAGRSDEEKALQSAAVRLADLTRKVAMLSGACLQLMFRLTNARKAAGLKKAAENRPILVRPAPSLAVALPRAVGAAEGQQLSLHVKALSVSYVEADEGYSSVEVEAGDVVELRLPRRNLLRVGVAQGSQLIARGEVREVNGKKLLEIEREPISSHAAAVWEDYLTTEMREVYDLRPQSIALCWEFSAMTELGGRNELRGRV